MLEPAPIASGDWEVARRGFMPPRPAAPGRFAICRQSFGLCVSLSLPTRAQLSEMAGHNFHSLYMAIEVLLVECKPCGRRIPANATPKEAPRIILAGGLGLPGARL